MWIGFKRVLCSMKVPFWRRLACVIALVASVLLFAGCNLVGGRGSPTPTPTPRVIVPPPTRTPTPASIPTPTPTPQLLGTPTPEPTPMPAAELSVEQVTQLVFLQVRACADQLATEGSKVELALTSVYSSEEKQWFVNVISRDGAITFGQYRVSDTTGEVTSKDIIAAQVLQSGVTCTSPAARLTKGPIPPKITIASVFSSKEEAQLGVWLESYNCYDVFPEATSFTAYDYGAGKWVVEGKSATTHYGLWEVDGITGKITPLDQLAAQAAAKCGLPAPASFPPAVTGEQAELRVWISVYDCINPKPKSESFKVYVDSPQRWLVEGKEAVTVEVEVEKDVAGVIEKYKELRIVTSYYGLWTVDVTNATIAPWDNIARATAGNACYHK